NFQNEKSWNQNKSTDTFFFYCSPEFELIKRKIKALEKEITQSGKQSNILESQLMEKNLLLGKKINHLIAEAESKAVIEFANKTEEADRLATNSYEWLALYTLTAVLLLLAAIFVLFNYLKKSRIYQKALTEASKKAEKLAMAKEQFAANVSHELRTPVNAIYGLTEQLMLKNKDDDSKQMISAVFKSAGHLKNIVNDTLDFTKIQANKIRFESVSFSPAELFEDVFTLQKYEAEFKGIPVYFEWQGENPETLIGDPLRLKQILINLISNAIKFTEEGEVRIITECINTADDIYSLKIQIADTGIGMKKSDIDVIFDEYVQAENITGKKYSGTGLGLSIVKKLVELQNGSIEVESKPGKGTKVTVTLSYSKGEKIIPVKSISNVNAIPETIKKLKILIVDDEEYNRFLIASIFQKWGIRYNEVKNGNEAVAQIQKDKYDIVLMDLNMPGINGIEASGLISKINPEVAIIATTAIKDFKEKKAFNKAGMNGYLLKPFSEKDLFDAINTVLKVKNRDVSVEINHQVNLDELLHLANGDLKFLNEMIRLFIKSTETGIAEIEKAIKDGNRVQIYENAHKMAAPAKHIGAGKLYNNIKNLEKTARENDNTDLVINIFQQIKQDLTALNQLLTNYLVTL
ncbi:MAG: response regulator, partial [Bacteroidetes bacterium]